MAELMALLKGPNRASSSFTPPPGYESAVDPSPWAQPTLILDNGDTSAPTIVNAPADHPVNNLLAPPASATMLEPPMLIPPPISTSVPVPHPTLDERDFQAIEEYIIRFYRWGPAAHEDLVNSPRVEDGRSPGATPTPNMAIQTELTHLKAERDHLRREVAEKDEQLVDQRPLQRELAQTRAELQRCDQELAPVNAAFERSRKRARGGPYTP
ncbi:hypothetical protein CRG98_005375 [Punica granatum]|uniref:Uncharacterized protein n=1 Tax=Punica granatum TaxID=22663 RepID=A0A2I0L0K8_PUNGR|nr:hypothetical protein CRG98_005375 [Punica granatum]